MSGPIIRTAPTPQYSENWERAFGEKKTATTAETEAKPKPAKQSAKKKAAPKAATKKAAPKKAAKKK